MGTRSRIGVMHGDTVKSVYCHWDGYLEHNGRMLQEYYDSARANHLVALGDLSVLGPVLGQAHAFSKHDIEHTDPECQSKLVLLECAEAEGWCKFYGRDRGEKNTEFKVAHTFAAFLDQVEGCGAEYYYIMRDGVWYCGSPDKGSKLVALADALIAIQETV